MIYPFKIKGKEWNNLFIPLQVAQQTIFYVDLFSMHSEAALIQQNLSKCKYCKAYPFTITQPIDNSVANECQLCGSINQHKMRHYLMESQHQTERWSNSYILKQESTSLSTVRLFFLIENLEMSYIYYLIESLKGICQSNVLQMSFLIALKNNLAIIDFAETPQLVILSKDINVAEQIQQKKVIISSKIISDLEFILTNLSEQYQKKSQSQQVSSYQHIALISGWFKEAQANRSNILIWFGTIPTQVATFRHDNLLIIAVVVGRKKLQICNSLIESHQLFTQLHYLYGPHSPEQLYYKIYQILDEQHLALLISGMIFLRTNKKYSGNLLNQPSKLYNKSTSLIAITTTVSQYHKIQIGIQYSNRKGEKYKFISNCQQNTKRIKNMWLQLINMISKALLYVLDQYKKKKINKQSNLQYDVYHIRTSLQSYGQIYTNTTANHKALLQHVIRYFEQFGKNAYKTYLPFSLIFKKALIFIFYPLWQGGILYHPHNIWIEKKSAQEPDLDWLYSLIGVTYIPPEKELPLFYRLCIDDEKYCYIQQ